MLKFFNRLEKTRNFVLLIFAILMVASLVFFYAPTRSTAGADLLHSQEVAARVSGETITVGELARQKEQYAQFSRGQSFPAKLMLNGLISSRIARVEAARLGLTASDAEVAAAIRQQLKSEDGKPLDLKRYEENMAAQYGSVAAFEETVRDDLSAKKLEAYLTSGVTVSEEELLNDFNRKNTKFDVSYISVSTPDLAKTITPTDEELRQYYEANKQSYYISVPQKKIRYVFVNTDKIGEKLNISEQDLRAEYDNVPVDKKKAGVAGQEIVFRVAKPDFDAQVLDKATKVYQDLKKSGNAVSEEAFATAAKGFSENPATAGLGGKLPGPVKENPSNPTDPYQQLLSMKPGEISEPISYKGRYFILRRGEDIPKTFEDAKKELEVSLRNRRAYAVAAELAQRVAENLKQTKDPQKTASEFAAQANMNVADMVRETPYVKPGDDVPNIGNSPDFEAGIASLENPTDVGDKIPVQKGFAIPMLADKKDPRTPEFDEVKGQIIEVVKLEKARQQVEEIAKQIASSVNSAGDLSGAAQAKSLAAQEQKAYTLGSPLGQGPSASSNEELENAIFALRDGGVTKTPVKVGDNWYIVGVTHREDPKPEEFAKQRDELMQQMLGQKRQAIFSDYLASARHRMETDGDIRIYQDVLAKVDGEDEVPLGEAEE